MVEFGPSGAYPFFNLNHKKAPGAYTPDRKRKALFSAVNQNWLLKHTIPPSPSVSAMVNHSQLPQ